MIPGLRLKFLDEKDWARQATLLKFQGCTGGSKPDEADTGKPQLPQQEPAVGPGQKIKIPESKSEAPEPKTDAPNPLGGLFGGAPATILP